MSSKVYIVWRPSLELAKGVVYRVCATRDLANRCVKFLQAADTEGIMVSEHDLIEKVGDLPVQARA